VLHRQAITINSDNNTKHTKSKHNVLDSVNIRTVRSLPCRFPPNPITKPFH